MFRYIDRALCALWDKLHPEVMNERLFPSVDALSQMKDDMAYLTQQSDGSTCCLAWMEYVNDISTSLLYALT